MAPAAATVATPAIDRRHLAGPFDIVGDVHGCADELEALLGRLGYGVAWMTDEGERVASVTPPAGRTLVLVGDLVDRGPRTPDVLRIAIASAQSGGLCVEGNHDNKLARWLAGRTVTQNNGLKASIDQMEAESQAFRDAARSFLDALPTYLWLDGGSLVVAHAGLKEGMIGLQSGPIRAFAMYGDVDGQTDEDGYPIRRDWAAKHSGGTAIVYGHVAAPEAEWVNNTICLDTGCVYGGRLTALRWPEREIVSVPASREWYVTKRSLAERKRHFET